MDTRYGIRTRVTAVRGRRPSPLDEPGRVPKPSESGRRRDAGHVPADQPLACRSSRRRPHFTTRFRASYSDTLEVLDRELSKLGAHSVVIELALDEGDIRLDGLPRPCAPPPPGDSSLEPRTAAS